MLLLVSHFLFAILSDQEMNHDVPVILASDETKQAASILSIVMYTLIVLILGSMML